MYMFIQWIASVCTLNMCKIALQKYVHNEAIYCVNMYIYVHVYIYSPAKILLFWKETAIYCNTLQHTSTHCNTLQHTATHCNTLQHAATHCNTLQHTERFKYVPCQKRSSVRKRLKRKWRPHQSHSQHIVTALEFVTCIDFMRWTQYPLKKE